MSVSPSILKPVITDVLSVFDQVDVEYPFELRSQEVGTVTSLGKGIAHCTGLDNVQSEERVVLANRFQGMAFNLDPDEVGIILLSESHALKAGCEVKRTKQVLDAPVGDMLLGRVIDARGNPLDNRGWIASGERLPIEREAPAIMDRAPVTEPLQTGIKVIDALIPIGQGQRMLILGDRQTGKTAIAIDTILNQKGKDVICIYCAIGQRSSATAKLIQELRDRDAMDYCIVVVAGGDSSPGLQYITPYAATSMAEYFMEQGRDVLIIYDDLTQHARAYRELSLLLRRPPGREAFPGDIFYIHARLLERATHLRPELGGGSLTALPIVETEAQNLSAYIPTNLVSITDGQLYLTPDLYQKGIFPAIDVGRSVSRVGGKAQRAAYQIIAGDLRLTYSQFEELESFARFGTRLEETTRRSLERGRRVRAILQQKQYQPMPVAEQVAVLLAVNRGLLDEIPLDQIAIAEQALRQTIVQDFPHLCQTIQDGHKLTEADQTELLNGLQTVLLPTTSISGS